MKMFELIKGNQSFKNFYFKSHEKEFLNLVKDGQNPKVLFIGCSDSRVIPNLIINTGPGELFVVRNIGNFVPPYSPDDDYHGTAAAIEYAVEVLNVEDIIVCGHSHCGACESLHKPPKKNLLHVNKWLELGLKAKKFAILSNPKTTEDLYRLTERISIVFQLENLLTYPYIKNKVDNEKLFIHGWYYKIETGEIECYNSSNQSFEPISSFGIEWNTLY